MSCEGIESNVPAEDELIAATKEVLSHCDPYSVSAKQIRSQLEELFGCDLQSKKDLIRSTIETYLFEKLTDEKEEEKEESLSEEDEQVPQGKAKKATGFNKSVAYMEQLAAFMGCAIGPRSLVMQMVWKHIKSNNLQNPKDKREIICDATLEALFHRKSVNMFKMTKLLSSMMKEAEFLQAPSESEEEDNSVGQMNGKKRSFSSSAAEPSKKRSKTSGKQESSSTKKTNGFLKPMAYSSRLSEFMGRSEGPRTEVTKELWAYIREHSLQNPKDKREILCDEKLEKLFRRKTVGMFKMAKYTSKMMKSLGEISAEDGFEDDYDDDDHEMAKESRKSTDRKLSAKIKAEKERKKELRKANRKTADRPESKRATGFQAPVHYSNRLSEFMGKNEGPRTEVTKELWAYIRQHNLQNPEDKREILCDEKLEKLFQKKRFTMFQMTKYASEMMSSLKDQEVDNQSNGNEPLITMASDPHVKNVNIYNLKPVYWRQIVMLSPALQDFVGTPYALRSAVVKRIRNHIKTYKLQRVNKHGIERIYLDETLQKVFGKHKIDAFELKDRLAKQITKVRVKKSIRKKDEDGDRELSGSLPTFLHLKVDPRTRTGSSIRKLSEVQIRKDIKDVRTLNPILREVVGCCQATVSQTIKLLMDYASEKKLLRGTDSSRYYIQCDAKLFDLFKEEFVKQREIRKIVLKESCPVREIDEITYCVENIEPNVIPGAEQYKSAKVIDSEDEENEVKSKKGENARKIEQRYIDARRLSMKNCRRLRLSTIYYPYEGRSHHIFKVQRVMKPKAIRGDKTDKKDSKLKRSQSKKAMIRSLLEVNRNQ